MSQPQTPVWRKISIPCSQIDAVYGIGNNDNAGDDLVYFLRLVSEYPAQYRYRFNYDLSHPNPHFHTLDFEIQDLADEVYERLVAKVLAAGLTTVPR